MGKINWLGLYKDEIKIEIENREREVSKLLAEIAIYCKVKDELEKVISHIAKDKESE